MSRGARRWRFMTTIVAAVLCAATLTTGAEARPLDEVVASKNIRIVTYLDNLPFSDEKDGKPFGIEIDLGRAIARELGVDAEFVLRMQGETADDDLRANVWRGPLTGGGVGDVMLHVPVDREFALRNKEAVIGNPYFQQRIVLAIHPELTGEQPNFDIFKEKKVSVQLGTVADYFLMRYEDGALIDNISHFVKPEAGAKEFLSKETSAWLGIRSDIEGLLRSSDAEAVFVEPPMDGIVRTNWVLGTAVNEKSRDLQYAIGAAIDKISESGEIEKIYAKYGVTYIRPPL